MSLRKVYLLRLVSRCVIFALCVCIAVFSPSQLTVLEGDAFFHSFGPLHLLWALWMFEMISRLLPFGPYEAAGSRKMFARFFRPVEKAPFPADLTEHLVKQTEKAYHIFVLWIALIVTLGMLHGGVIGDEGLFIISALFYVCDLICVLFWCPFRLYLKNRCCTTCRIFSWDCAMMFSPLALTGGFFGLSLFVMALLIWLVWEASVFIHPERFFEKSNAALSCQSCSDLLCGKCREEARR